MAKQEDSVLRSFGNFLGVTARKSGVVDLAEGFLETAQPPADSGLLAVLAGLAPILAIAAGKIAPGLEQVVRQMLGGAGTTVAAPGDGHEHDDPTDEQVRQLPLCVLVRPKLGLDGAQLFEAATAPIPGATQPGGRATGATPGEALAKLGDILDLMLPKVTPIRPVKGDGSPDATPPPSPPAPPAA